MKTISEIMEALAAPLEPAYTLLHPDTGAQYIPWQNVPRILNDRAGFGGWEVEMGLPYLSEIQRGSKSAGYNEVGASHCLVTIVIYGSDGTRRFSNIGVDDQPTGQRGTGAERAVAAGMRRALVTTGCGVALYDKERHQQSGGGRSDSPQRPSAPPAGSSDMSTALFAELEGAKFPSDAKRIIGDFIRSVGQPDDAAVNILKADVANRIKRAKSENGLKMVGEIVAMLTDANVDIGRDEMTALYREAKARIEAAAKQAGG